MLCKFWVFQGGGYVECHLLGYRSPVRTSQETHYVSATESSRLMLCKIWGFQGGGYEYRSPVRTSQETHYVSSTELSQLMLCKIWGFHGGGYEECHLLGYRNPVRTSQETHYFSTTESSRLMLCKIWGFHGSDYEECRHLRCGAVFVLLESTFQRNLSPPSVLVFAKVLPTSEIPFSPMMKATCSSETSGHNYYKFWTISIFLHFAYITTLRRQYSVSVLRRNLLRWV
jgi:hypothetical protein